MRQIFTGCKIFLAVMAVKEYIFNMGSPFYFQVFKEPKRFFLQWMQLKGLSPAWFLSCTFKSSLDTKAQLQSWQLKALSQVSVLSCTFKSSLDKKSFVEVKPVKGFHCMVGSFMHFQMFTGYKSLLCNECSPRVYLWIHF